MSIFTAMGGGLGALGGVTAFPTAAAGVYGADKAYDAQKEANQASAMEAHKQRQWASTEAGRNRRYNTNMSNSAMQRRVADMKAAGINPLMAAGGPGASNPGSSTPAGAHANQIPADAKKGYGAAIGGGIAQALKAITALAERDKTEAQTNKITHEGTSAKATAEADTHSLAARKEATRQAYELKAKLDKLHGDYAKEKFLSDNIRPWVSGVIGGALGGGIFGVINRVFGPKILRKLKTPKRAPDVKFKKGKPKNPAIRPKTLGE